MLKAWRRFDANVCQEGMTYGLAFTLCHDRWFLPKMTSFAYFELFSVEKLFFADFYIFIKNNRLKVH